MSSPTLFELTPVMREVLEQGGTVKLKPCGISMLPFIREEKDEIWLSRPTLPLRKRSVFLYQRTNGKLVLHRLIKFKNGKLVFRGDNQLRNEYDILPQQLIGQVVCVRRGDKIIHENSFLFILYAGLAFPICFINKVTRRIRRNVKKSFTILLGR